MWSVSVYLDGLSGPLTLFFKSEEGAEDFTGKVADALEHEILVDDFGQKVILSDNSDVVAMTTSSCENTAEVQLELSLIQAKAQARLQARAMQDPELMRAQQRMNMLGQGRGVLT